MFGVKDRPAPRHGRARHSATAGTSAFSRRVRQLWPLGIVLSVAMIGSLVLGLHRLGSVADDTVSKPSLLALLPTDPPNAPSSEMPPISSAPPEPTATPTTAAATTTATREKKKATAAAPAPAPRRNVGSGGVPWASGLWVGRPASITEWESFRGRKVDVVNAFAERGSWKEIESVSWIMGYYKDSPSELVISQPFWPEGSGGSLSACASGAYDENWARYGTTLKNSGRTDAYTRLAWEFNGTWFEWSSTDVEAWKDCYRKVVQAVRSTAPGARFEWNMNAHGSSSSDGDAWKSYPGDDVVDIVGIDPYDHYPPSRTEAEFDKQCTGNEGLCTVMDFARKHGKLVGVTEWGVMSAGAGDNPLYIEKMYETFLANKDVMAYETYFSSAEHGSALIGQNPKSAAAYKSLWGS